MSLVSSVCSTVPVTINEGSDDDFPSHRFADQQCDDTFEVLCRRNLQEETGIPTSAPTRLDNGQGAINGNGAKKFSIEMFGAVAGLLAIGLLVAFFLLRNERLEVGKLRERGIMLGASASSENSQSEVGNETQPQRPKPLGGGNQQAPPVVSSIFAGPADPVLEFDLEV